MRYMQCSSYAACKLSLRYARECMRARERRQSTSALSNPWHRVLGAPNEAACMLGIPVYRPQAARQNDSTLPVRMEEE